MAHFAKLNNHNIVEDIIVISNQDCLDENGFESEIKGAQFCNSLISGRWIKTSYNTRGGIYYNPENNEPSQDQSKAFRKNHPGIGYTYDEARDAFIPPKPFDKWILNEDTCRWEAPVPYPTDGNNYVWNDNKGEWEEVV